MIRVALAGLLLFQNQPFGPFRFRPGERVPLPYRIPHPILKHPIIQKYFEEVVYPYYRSQRFPLTDSSLFIDNVLWSLVYFPLDISTLKDTLVAFLHTQTGIETSKIRLILGRFFDGTALVLADTGYVAQEPDSAMPCWEGVYRYHVKEVLWQAPWSTYRVQSGTWITIYGGLVPGDSGRRMWFPGGRWEKYFSPAPEDLRFPMLVSAFVWRSPSYLSRCWTHSGVWIPDRFPQRMREWVRQKVDGEEVWLDLLHRKVHRVKLSELRRIGALVRRFFQQMEREVGM